jgi:hypothetical protein
VGVVAAVLMVQNRNNTQMGVQLYGDNMHEEK